MYSTVIHQPEYLPWINLFIKMSMCETFIFLDNVQYQRRSYQNRNLVLLNNSSKLLTVPLEYAAQETLISDIKIDNSQKWINSHISVIKNCYQKTRYFEEVFELIEIEYKKKFIFLNDLNKSLILAIAKKLKIKCKFLSATDMSVEGKKSDLILNICKKLNTKKYITGIGSKSYLDIKKFSMNNIETIFLKPINFKYSQVNNEKSFVPNLSIIDFLFNQGFDKFKDITN
jgi:hypothetical protein